ncbi:5408_t:CDS:2 [Rhizophagus irregularis]|nr:5408_t:CDS:2 [Rhizophagus irregularis]
MSSKQITKKRGVVACNKCKRDKKKCDGSYLTQKPCKNCRDRNERCEYIEPSRLKANEMINNISSNISNIEDIQYQDFPLRQNLDKSNIILQLLTDPSTTNEQTIILKRLYNEITRNPENPNFIGNKRDELFMKLKLLSSSSSSSTDNNDHTKIQIWDDLYKPPKVRVIKGNKKTNDIKKRKSRKNQRENKRT